jgi:hypothetical protein
VFGDVRGGQGAAEALAGHTDLLGGFFDRLALAGHEEVDRGVDPFRYPAVPGACVDGGCGIVESGEGALSWRDVFHVGTIDALAGGRNALKRHAPDSPLPSLRRPLLRVWRSGPPRVRRRGGGPLLKKDRTVAAIHYRNRPDSFQSRHKARAGNRRVAMASCRSKVRVAVRALVKRRERPRRRVRPRTLSTHR